jgi:predicted enzyme related to lactoylglutathione lyase
MAGAEHPAVSPHSPSRLVHLELHTQHLAGASAFYAELLRWRTEPIHAGCGTYHALAVGGGLDGGIVECCARQSRWLPYVEVTHIDAVTERARQLGASVLLEPREGPAGWRSVLSTRAGGEIALWQPKLRVVGDTA